MALVAAAVAAVFAARLFGQYRARRRGHALAWTVSLALFGVGSLAVAAGIALAWTPTVFAVYWFSGALVTVPLLAVGQLMLMDPRRTVLYATLGALVVVWALAALALSPIDGAVLRAATAAGNVPLGEEVLGDSLAYRLLGVFNYSAVIVVAGTLYSAVKTRRWQILLIPLGVVVAGASFAFIRAQQPAGFSAALAAGVAIMYAGFRAAGKPPRRPPAPTTA